MHPWIGITNIQMRSFVTRATIGQFPTTWPEIKEEWVSGKSEFKVTPGVPKTQGILVS